MNLEWLRVGVIGVLLVLVAIVGAGCAMDGGEEQAPSPMARANSRIFSRDTVYGADGGSEVPT